MSKAKTVLFRVSGSDHLVGTAYALVELGPVQAAGYACLVLKLDAARKSDSRDIHSIAYHDDNARYFEDKDDIVGTLDETEELSCNGHAVLSDKSARKLAQAIKNGKLAENIRTDVERAVVKEDRLHFTAYDHYSDASYDTYAIYLSDLQALSKA